MRTARAAHNLQSDEAKRHHPVRLQAVVTYYDPDTDVKTGALFGCDSTGCICVLVPSRPILPIRAGTLIDITGVSEPGNYAPIVIASEVHVAARSHLPLKPARRSLAHLMTGADDGQWVEVEGVVHSFAQSGHNLTITARVSPISPEVAFDPGQALLGYSVDGKAVDLRVAAGNVKKALIARPFTLR